MPGMSTNSKHTPTPSNETPEEIRSRLRAQAKKARSALAPETRASKSKQICAKLTQHLDALIAETPQGKPVVGVYSAFPWEVDLGIFIDYAYLRGCTVAFPCMMPDAHGIPDAPGRGMRKPGSSPNTQHVTQQTMEMRSVSAEAFRSNGVPFLNDPLKEYRHNSPELTPIPYLVADEFAFIVVPAVGFDAHGNRLGYGAGNYDRYLCQLTDACHVVGVAFTEQEVSPIPVEDHDIPLPFVTA